VIVVAKVTKEHIKLLIGILGVEEDRKYGAQFLFKKTGLQIIKDFSRCKHFW
jgi:hypothetical protein